ncbi:MAG: hypothetical protein R3F60_08430 [bacterium]
MPRPPARRARRAAGYLGSIDEVPDIAGFSEGEEGVEHPFVHPTGLLYVVPGVTYRLTLLVEPGPSCTPPPACCRASPSACGASG